MTTRNRATRRVFRIAADIRRRWGDPYRAYAASVASPLSYDRWVGTLSKNQQIRHAEMQRRLSQALNVQAES